MRVSKLIKFLGESQAQFGDQEVKVGANFGEARVEQLIEDVLSGDNSILLVSKGFMDEDPLYKLPQLSAVPDGGYGEPQ